MQVYRRTTVGEREREREYNVCIVEFVPLLSLPDGPEKTAALAAWFQGRTGWT